MGSLQHLGTSHDLAYCDPIANDHFICACAVCCPAVLLYGTLLLQMTTLSMQWFFNFSHLLYTHVNLNNMQAPTCHDKDGTLTLTSTPCRLQHVTIRMVPTTAKSRSIPNSWVKCDADTTSPPRTGVALNRIDLDAIWCISVANGFCHGCGVDLSTHTHTCTHMHAHLRVIRSFGTPCFVP